MSLVKQIRHAGPLGNARRSGFKGMVHSGNCCPIKTYKASEKLYRCVSCKTEKMLVTNHFHECYPYCNRCSGQTTWVCRELDFDVIIKRMEESDAKRHRL